MTTKRNKPKSIERQSRIASKLMELKSGQSVTCAELQELCNGSAEKNIRRDITALRKANWAIESGNFGYRLRSASEAEISPTDPRYFGALMIAGCAIDKNIRAVLPEAAESIKHAVFKVDDVDAARMPIVERSVDSPPSIYSEEQIKTFGKLARKLIDEQAISFDYTNVGEEETEVRAVYPIQLKLKHEVWYLLSWDLEKDGIRVFKLPKIKNVRSCEQEWEIPSSSCIDEVLQSAQFSIWHRSGEATKIRIKVERHAKEHVEHYEITPNQRLVNEGDDSVVEFETSDIIGVLSWCRHYIHDIEILSPDSLKKQFFDELCIGLEKHKV